MMDTPIGIVIATKIEASPLIRSAGMKRVSREPVPVFSGGDMVLAVSGVGKVHAGAATAALIERYRPRVMVNLGAAGGTRDDIAPGSMFQIRSVIESDLWHAAGFGPPVVLEGDDAAVLATADTPVLGRDERARAAKTADLVDMEGAGFARVCGLYGTPCHLRKVVTDNGDERVEDIIAAMERYSAALCEHFMAYVLPRLPR